MTPKPDNGLLSKNGVLVFAHRGGQGLWPPNTLYAYERAVAMGVDVLELDIHSTADGVLVARHDPSVDATTNGKGLIQALSLAEIKALDAGYRWTGDGGRNYPYRGQGITIPTLEEVLAAFPEMPLNIDIKPKDASVVTTFYQMLRHFNKLDQVVVGSFHDDQLRRFRALAPQAATAAGVAETRQFFWLNLFYLSLVYRRRATAFQIPEYAGRLHVVTPRFVKGAHAHGLQVHVWTVNEVSDMQRLIAWEVDGIISDYPDRLMTLLGRQIEGTAQ
jgi:glycerophosphoryl diester phosphodiesterase